jgi:hypothetical protein
MPLPNGSPICNGRDSNPSAPSYPSDTSDHILNGRPRLPWRAIYGLCAALARLFFDILQGRGTGQSGRPARQLVRRRLDEGGNPPAAEGGLVAP